MPQTIGEQLKQAREARGLSLEQAAQSTRVRVHYLKALEDDRLDQLPSAVQGRGFLRLYADYLGLTVQPLLDQWEGRAQPEELPAPPVSAPAQPPDQDENTESGPMPAAELAGHEPLEAPEEDAAGEETEIEPAEDEELAPPGEVIQLSPREEKPGAPPAVQSQAILKEIGAVLRQRRETISLSLSDVEHYTRLRQHYLRALEEGRINDLPSAVQGRGMLSNYAEFLNLDVDSLLGKFADALQARRIELQPAASRPISSRPVQPEDGPAGSPARAGKTGARAPAGSIPLPRLVTPDLLIVGTLIVLLVIFVIWAASRVTALSTAADEPTAPPLSEVLLGTGEPGITATLEPTASTPIPPGLSNPTAGGLETGAVIDEGTLPAQSNSPVQVYVVAHQRAWMRIMVDGGVAFSGRIIPGNAYPFSGLERIELLTGNGAALQVFYNQSDLGTLGTPGQVVSLIFLPDSLITPTPAFTPTRTATQPATLTPQPTPTQPTATITPFIP
ncbi:MAG: DUF4115 domain-containing protein [Chloroflexi bacterium]|nr:DUF4115 domain-containing protein [Chloroflexota bacterium]